MLLKWALEINAAILENVNKDDLIRTILNLNSAISKLYEDQRKVTNLRLYHLERKLNMYSQYTRRDTLEITGIPLLIKDDKLEDEVIEIYKDAKATLNRQPIKKLDIQAVHRIGKKGRVIVKVVNRKFVRKALVNRKYLKGNTRYGERTRIFLNDSFIPEFGFFNYVIRKAYKEKLIYKYRVRNGVNFIQKSNESEFVEIGHENDLMNLGIEIPDRD